MAHRYIGMMFKCVGTQGIENFPVINQYLYIVMCKLQSFFTYIVYFVLHSFLCYIHYYYHHQFITKDLKVQEVK